MRIAIDIGGNRMGGESGGVGAESEVSVAVELHSIVHIEDGADGLSYLQVPVYCSHCNKLARFALLSSDPSVVELHTYLRQISERPIRTNSASLPPSILCLAVQESFSRRSVSSLVTVSWA